MSANTFSGNSVWSVSPTENDLKGAEGAGGGIVIQESKIGPSLRGSGQTGAANGYIVSGFTLPSSGSRTAVAVTAGTAVIDGFCIKGSTSLTIDVDASTTCWVYLQLLYASGLVSSVGIRTEYVEATKPVNAILLGKLTTDASNVTGMVDARPQRKISYGSVVGSTGAVLEYGSGDWVATRGSTGSYTVTFYGTTFLRAPVGSATAHNSGAARSASVTPTPGNGNILGVVTTNAGALADVDFSFFAIL
jgi:hypothetical protein